jgi:hypothetical protein
MFLPHIGSDEANFPARPGQRNQRLRSAVSGAVSGAVTGLTNAA